MVHSGEGVKAAALGGWGWLGSCGKQSALRPEGQGLLQEGFQRERASWALADWRSHSVSIKPWGDG